MTGARHGMEQGTAWIKAAAYMCGPAVTRWT